ncbi:dTMP kinase [Acidocella aromatica]|uniref:Thymidylate kinase n=1 Tax=Acidocella aromatica TaxID=1303579 RepID=A0A840VQ15_9PROT|nr:dTMP kinase [Acidocella aromatica]MBB5372392.1 dTMP kinase [Acidocella aromatica]
MNRYPGLFITLEGGEGAGKSTAAKGLAELLRAEGHEVLATREPGGTKGAEAIRALLLGTETPLHPLAQTMLHFAARADHVETVLRPALERGAIVICDRFYDSTMAYQGYAQGVGVEVVDSLIRLIDLVPDLSFFLRVSEDVAKARLVTRAGATDRYESMGEDFTAKLMRGFEAIAAKEPGRCLWVNSSGTPKEVVAQLRQLIAERAGR